MRGYLIFGGTSEARQLVEELASRQVPVTVSVATQYGGTLLPKEAVVLTQRMNQEEMEALMRQERFLCVVDATHPYACQVTQNIQGACEATNTPYLRLARPSSDWQGNVLYKETHQAAVSLLEQIPGKVLLTTGSKDLELYTNLRGFQERLFPRILPVESSLKKCLELGFPVSHIIAMQGPFSKEMNLALLRQIGANVLVTKESGAAGGFQEKLEAAQEAGAKLLVIGRPAEGREGLDFSQIIERLQLEYQLPTPKPCPLRFPLFVDLRGKRVLVVGGGGVAFRRIRKLTEFGCQITVIAPELSEKLDEKAHWEAREWRQGDCAGYELVLAATNDHTVNRMVGLEAKSLGIPVNVCDAPEACDFYFPAIARKGPVVAGITACGVNHRLAAESAQRVRDALENLSL